MIALEEPSAQYQRPILNPREPPPQVLKDVFKHFQKLQSGAIETDVGILDFDKDISSHRLELYDNIPPDVLARVYEKFVGDDIKLPNLGAQPIYSSKGLPGLLILPSFLPPSIQKELLSRLLHRDLSDPVHQTNVHMFHDLPYPPPISSQEPSSAISGQDTLSLVPASSEILDQGAQSANPETSTPASFFTYPPTSKVSFPPKDSSVHKPLSITKFLNKSLRWCTLGGQYDWTEKLYPAAPPPPFPKDIEDLLSGLFPAIKSQAAIVNLYSPGDTLSLHRDVSEESDKGLVSVSLGCDCLFVVGLGEKGQDGGDYVTVRLRSGDAVVMSKEARWAWHGVPKILRGTCPSYLEDWPAEATNGEGEEEGEYEAWRGWMKTKRANLNVRQMFG